MMDVDIQKAANNMLFLGAGASNAVGIGHLSILTEKIIKKLNNTKYSTIINNIISGIDQKNQYNLYYQPNEIDIEVILSILNKCINPKESLKYLGPYAIFCSETDVKNIKLNINKKDLKEIYKIIDGVITQHCKKYDKNILSNFITNSSNTTPEYLKMLISSDLIDANLSYAKLFHANLTDANLTDANLTDAKGLPISRDEAKRRGANCLVYYNACIT
jgi:hypothetical protein